MMMNYYKALVKVSEVQTWYTKARSKKSAIDHIDWEDDIIRKEDDDSESWEIVGGPRICTKEEANEL